MKHLKKLNFGLGLGVGIGLLVSAVFSLVFASRSFAAEIPQSDIVNASYTFQDGANIVGDYGKSGKVIFVDAYPTDQTRNFVPNEEVFCDPDGGPRFGINIDKDADPTATTVPAQVEIGYIRGVNNCQRVDQPNITINNSGAAGAADLQWAGVNISTLDGVKNAQTLAPGSDVPKLAGDIPSIYSADDGKVGCEEGGFYLVVVLSSVNAGKEYLLRPLSGGGLPPELKDYVDPKCKVGSTRDVTIIGTYGSSPAKDKDGGSGSGGSVCDASSLSVCLNTVDGPDSSACMANSHTSMEWLICPTITSISKFADVINGYVEDQLHFRVDSMLPDCSKSSTDQDCQVNRAWSIIKNIVATLLVIIMLVMVISQAIDKGPFDAYTVKKILPRLVIAVIAMQFSWVLTKYAIDVANDLGVGIKQILLAPFGGGDNLTLPAILNNLDESFPITTTYAIWGVLLVLLFTPASTFILPILLFIALAIGSALFVAMVTLVIRNILIIMAVIFSPVALLLWILPGQTFQSYWKKYSDNFIKLLLLFPLVMAMIYAGRIAAWLGGDIGLPGLIDYLVVLIAFFGPLFFLPKTFKWGGSILAGANQAINQSKLLNAAKNWGYGRIKAEAARRSDTIGREWNQQDKYLRMGQREFSPNLKWWKKGGRLNPMTLATTRPQKDAEGNTYKDYQGKPIRVGRKMPMLQGRKIFSLGGRAMFEKGLSNEGLLERTEAAKQKRDQAAAIRRQRDLEAARKGNNAQIEYYYDKNGKLKHRVYPKGRKAYSTNAGRAATLRQLNSPDSRDAGQAAVDFFNDPEALIHAMSRIPMDPSNRRSRERQQLEKLFGYDKEGDYNLNNPSPRDRQLERRLKGLQDKHERGEELTDDEKKTMKDLATLFEVRKANLRPENAQWQAQIRTNIETLKTTDRFALEEADADSPWANVDEHGNELPENEKIYWVRPTRHNKTQEKATSTPPLTQAIGNVSPQDKPVMVAKMYEEGYQPTDDPTGPMGQGKFTSRDEYAYFIGDHDDMSTEAKTGEAQEIENRRKFREGKFSYDLGQTGKNNKESIGPPLLKADERRRLYYRSAENQDPNTTAVIGLKSQVESTREPFDLGFQEGGLNPGDIIGADPETNINIIEYLRNHRDPSLRKAWGDAVQEMYRMRRQVGLADNDAQGSGERDIRIAMEAPRYRYYDPQWSGEDMRATYDVSIDPYRATHPETVTIPEGVYEEFPELRPPERPQPPAGALEQLRAAHYRRYGGRDEAPEAPPPTIVRVPERRTRSPEPPGEPPPTGGGPTSPRPRPGMPGGPVFMPEMFEGEAESRQSAAAAAPVSSQPMAPVPAEVDLPPEIIKQVDAIGVQQLRPALIRFREARAAGDSAAMKQFAEVIQQATAQMDEIIAQSAPELGQPMSTIVPSAAVKPQVPSSQIPLATSLIPPAAPPPATVPTLGLIGQNVAPNVTNVTNNIAGPTTAPTPDVRTVSQPENAGPVSTGSLRGGGSVNPGVLKIDHNGMYDTVYEASRKGALRGAEQERIRQGAQSTPTTNPPIPGNEPPAEIRGLNDPRNPPP